MGFLKTLSNATGNTNLPLLRVPNLNDVIGSSALKHWYSADKLVTADGSNRVSALGDQTANAANLVQGTYGLQPLLQASAQNGRPAIYNDSFPGDRLLSTAAVAPASQFEYTSPFSLGIAIVAGSLTVQYEILFGNYAPIAQNFRGYWINAGSITTGKLELRLVDTLNSPQITLTDNVALTAGSVYSFVFTYDGSGKASGIKMYKNGVVNQSAVATGSNLTAGNTLVDSNQRIRLFGSQNSNPASHKLLEGFICSGVLTSDQLSGVDNYFNKKYAIH